MHKSDPPPVNWPSSLMGVPYGIYCHPSIFDQEMERIFRGPTWNFVGLSVEVPNPGDYKLTNIANESLILVRAEDGGARVLENRCAHRGMQLCLSESGRLKRIVCPYHRWTYDLNGRLRGVPFRNGVLGQGGMPADFELEEFGLEELRVEEKNGLLFASFCPSLPSLDNYLGPEMIGYLDRVFAGRQLQVLGYQRHRIRANWKLVVENIKDPYHATLLHSFLVSLGLFRADQPSKVVLSRRGEHSALVSQRGGKTRNVITDEIPVFEEGFALNDPTLLEPAKEYQDSATVVMQTLWPNLIVQQQTNTLAIRLPIPRTPSETDQHWTYFGYETDNEEMTIRRLRQANLQGPSGLVGVDDWEVLQRLQIGLESAQNGECVIAMGGEAVESVDYMVSESAIRGFYGHYRRVMEL